MALKPLLIDFLCNRNNFITGLFPWNQWFLSAGGLNGPLKLQCVLLALGPYSIARTETLAETHVWPYLPRKVVNTTFVILQVLMVAFLPVIIPVFMMYPLPGTRAVLFGYLSGRVIVSHLQLFICKEHLGKCDVSAAVVKAPDIQHDCGHFDFSYLYCIVNLLNKNQSLFQYPSSQ